MRISDETTMAKILIVEDNEVNRDMLSRRLVSLSHEVITAYDGEQGYAVAYTERPDLILMDIALPGMDGLRATRLLRMGRQTAHIPIIVLTAYPSNREAAFAAGCDAYATKPIAFAKLREMIDRLLAKKGIVATTVSTPMESLRE
jgi:CheY-like chemotaxis protein